MQNNDKKYTIQQALLLFPPKNTEKTVDRKWRSRQEDDLQPFVMFRGGGNSGGMQDAGQEGSKEAEVERGTRGRKHGGGWHGSTAKKIKYIGRERGKSFVVVWFHFSLLSN